MLRARSEEERPSRGLSLGAADGGACLGAHRYTESSHTSRNPIRLYIGRAIGDEPSTAMETRRSAAYRSAADVMAEPNPRRRASGTVVTL